jgi:hypothetical protein
MIRSYQILLGIFVSLIFGLSAPANAGIDTVSDLVTDSNFKVVSTKKSFPSDVWKKFESWLGSGIADPGEEFNPGCIRTPDIPSSRLVSGGVASGVWYVHLEHGGDAVHPTLLIVVEARPNKYDLYFYRSEIPKELGSSLVGVVDTRCLIGPGHEELSEDEKTVCYSQHPTHPIPRSPVSGDTSVQFRASLF